MGVSMRSSKWISWCAACLIGHGICAIALSQWQPAETAGIFQIRSEFALNDRDGQEILRQLNTLQKDVQTLLNLKLEDRPVEISLFKSKASYRAHLAQRVPEGVDRTALFVQGTDMGRVYIYRRTGFDTDLRHESTHAVLHNALPYVPMWLDEGLAEYFEVVSTERSSGSPHLPSLKRSIFFGWRPNLERLEAAEDISDMGSVEYREAWAWAHFLLHGPQEVRQVLSDFLYEIESGEAAGSFRERLVAAVPNADILLVEHIRQWR